MAVLLVLAYHLGLPQAPGGFLGVDVFFVLSGYLITSQLWSRWSGQAPSRDSLVEFWHRRLRRLVPAVAAVVGATSLAVLLLDRDQVHAFVGDVVAAGTYTSNWWYVLHERSYFEASGRPPVLQHLWSLAVEEQFYLLWPLVVLGCLRARRTVAGRRRLLLTVTTAGAVGSALVMGVGTALAGAPAHADASRFYLGTDSHASGLLLGAAFAVWRWGAGFDPLAPRLRPCTLRLAAAGAAAMAALLLLVVRVDAWTPWLYRIGFPLVGVLVLVVIAAATRPGRFATLVGSPMLRSVGRRSYGLYLWHWPVVCFLRPGLDIPLDGVWAGVVQLGVIVLLSELGYRHVEVPCRRDGVRATLRRWTRQPWRRPAPAFLLGSTASLVAITVVAVLTPSPTGASAAGQALDALPSVPAPTALPPRPAPAPTTSATPATPTPSASAAPTPTVSASSSAATPRRVDAATFTLRVYGDSVALGAEPGLRHAFGRVVNRAGVGEQAGEVLGSLEADAVAGRLGDAILLLHTGDNGVIDGGQLSRTLDSVGDRPVLVVRPRVPRPWQQRNLDTIDEVVRGRTTVKVVDWHSASEGRRGWFVSDGTHLQTPGIAAYAAMIRDAAESIRS